MAQRTFAFDRELAAQQRAGREELAREAAIAEYRATTRWMLRTAAKLLLRLVGLFALLVLILWLFAR